MKSSKNNCLHVAGIAVAILLLTTLNISAAGQDSTPTTPRLVSTLPLPRLLAITSDVPPALTAAAARLQALPLTLVLVVIGHPVDTPIQRVYSASPEMPAHKIVINHNSSPHLRSLPHHGVLAEVSCLPGQQPAGALEDCPWTPNINCLFKASRLSITRTGRAQ